MYTGTLVEFLNMGGGEVMLILAVVLLLFGGKKLPELARGLGKGLRDFKDASEGVKREIHRNINAIGIEDEINELKSTFTDDNTSNRPHNYDYQPEESLYDDNESSHNHDEAAHYNATGSTDTDGTSIVENEHGAHIEEVENSTDAKHTEYSEHTEIETHKTKS